jgi:hypothetical protein
MMNAADSPPAWLNLALNPARRVARAVSVTIRYHV